MRKYLVYYQSTRNSCGFINDHIKVVALNRADAINKAMSALQRTGHSDPIVQGVKENAQEILPRISR